MLSLFDYIRRCKTGTELLLILHLHKNIEKMLGQLPLGVPYSAVHGPCQKCWVFARMQDSEYCEICSAIIDNSIELCAQARKSTVIWGYISNPPWQNNADFIKPVNALGSYHPDINHFLILAEKYSIKPWLEELVLTYGHELQGLIQIFPTMGKGPKIGMGDILCRAIHQETARTHDRLWIRFFPAPWQLLESKKRDEKGILTFQVDEFLDLIEAARVFKEIFLPQEQENLYYLLMKKDRENQHFYWGRFLRSVQQQARDLIDSWELRTWPHHKIEILYELLNYVYATSNH